MHYPDKSHFYMRQMKANPFTRKTFMSLCTYLLAGSTHTYTPPRALWHYERYCSTWYSTIEMWLCWPEMCENQFGCQSLHPRFATWSEMICFKSSSDIPKIGRVLFYLCCSMLWEYFWCLFELFFLSVDPPTFKIPTRFYCFSCDGPFSIIIYPHQTK